MIAGTTNFLHKKSSTAYNLDTAYVSRRIIGLPSKTISWGYDQSTLQLEKVSEVDYFYDEGDFSDTSLEQNIANVIMHDTGNYGTSFTVGRGNLSSIRYTKSAIRSPTYWVLVSVILKIQSISTREWRWKGA